MTWNLGKVGLCAFAATAAFACAKNTHDTSVGKAPTDHTMAENGVRAEAIDDQVKPNHHQAEKPSEHAIGGCPTRPHSRFHSIRTAIQSPPRPPDSKCHNAPPNDKD